MNPVRFGSVLTVTVLAAMLCPSPLHAWIRFERVYGGSADDQARSVRQTSDGGYIIVGLTNSFGAGGSDLYVIKTDAAGETTWTRTVGGARGDEAADVLQAPDGSYVIAGQTLSFGAGSADVYLVKLNAQGETLWTKTFGDSFPNAGYSVAETADSGYVIAGYSYTSAQNSNDALLIKTDRAGNMQWSRTYGDTMYEWASSVRPTTDGGYVFTGYTGLGGPGDRQVYIVKTDASGNTSWTRQYGGPKSEQGLCIELTGDGGYVVAGYTLSYGAGGRDFYLLRMNSAGDTVWTRTFGASDYDESYSVARTGDGGFVVAGYTVPPDTVYMEACLIKTDAGGNAEWTRTYSHSPSDDVAYAVRATSDGGFVIAGFTHSPAWDHDVYLIKTDANGTLSLAEDCSMPRTIDRAKGATVVKGLPPGAVAFDAMGRRVLQPKPGVYFVREEPQATSRKPQAVRKVLLVR